MHPATFIHDVLTNSTRSVSYVPLIAPSTTTKRIEFLSSIADTFIYIVSKVRMTHTYYYLSHEANDAIARWGPQAHL